MTEKTVFLILQSPMKRKSPSSLSPEIELLILSARKDWDHSIVERIKGLTAKSPDWNIIADWSRRMGLQPLMHRHLEESELRPLVPKEIRDIFRQSYLRSALKNAAFYEETRSILQEAEKSGLSILLLKGIYLAKWVYGDIALRPMSDIDILCRKEDLSAFSAILERCGFKQKIDEQARNLEGFEVIGHHMLPFFKGIFKIELHWRAFPNEYSSANIALSLEAETFEWESLYPRKLSPTCQILHLCWHLHHHLHYGSEMVLYWFADIHEYILSEGGNIEWDRIHDLAPGPDEWNSILDILGMMETFWNTPLPASIKTHNVISRSDFEKMIEEFCLDRLARKNYIHAISRHLRRTKLVGRGKNRWRLIWRLVFPNKAMMLMRAPKAKSPLFLLYVYRIGGFISKSVISLGTNLFKRS